MNRYKELFDRLKKEQRGAFIPFVVVGDPTIEISEQIIRTLIEAGADALELGIPFSDPVADGPVIQKAVLRSLTAGATPESCFNVIKKIRGSYPEIPVGILTYTNALAGTGMDNYFKQASAAGIDSVLAADMPVDEAEEYCKAASAADVMPVFIAPPDISEDRVKKIASCSKGYTYVVTRRGVTGSDREVMTGFSQTLDILKKYNAPPPVAGFGISTPDHVKTVLSIGAEGAISGSATVKIMEKFLDNRDKMDSALAAFVKSMKAAALNN